MAGFKLEIFKGTRPRISALKLAHGEAQTAQNVDLGTGDLEPWDDKSTEQAVSADRETRTIYRFDDDGTPIFFEWNDIVDVVRGPVKGDAIERTYYTGDTTGDGSPKLTHTGLAKGNPLLPSPPPYPTDWVYLGIPAPLTALTVTVPGLPEDVSSDKRFVDQTGLETPALEIDNVDFTVFPGVGSPTAIWRWDSTALGSIDFDVQIGTSFRVTEVINSNKVKLESASEPGIFVRTLNSDKSTVNDWQPLDEQGSTQEADAVGWRIPVGCIAKIDGHKLSIGDVITVSALSIPFSWSVALTIDLYEQSWAEPVLVNVGGTSFFNVPNARISPALVESDADLFNITGSFYYDVDRTASTVDTLEARTFVYTYVSDLGEEGPPSPLSQSFDILDGVEVLISGLALPPTIGFNIQKMRLYRTSSSEAGTEFQLIKEINVSTTARDAVPNAELGEIITTTTWDPPDPEMIGLTTMPNGMMVGFKGKNIFFCEPYFPHAWPPEYDQAIDYEIVGLAAFGNSVAVMTKGWPYLLTGSHPRNVNLRPIKVNQACTNKESIATDGDKVYYASPDGLVEISVNGVRVATENYLRKEDWTLFKPATMVGEFHEGRYYGFWDFDITIIRPVKTAEVSGTITTADENDIINGGKVIILTLTNDLWVAAGATFDAERQAIIDGLDATANQTLGWNNEVRDSALVVGNVVRTSDTVVTITMPTVAGYAIVIDEVIAPEIPASALQVSTSSIFTGSTFTIIALASSSTLTIGGDLDTDDEAAVRAGGNTITLTLTNDTWVSAGAVFDARRQDIIDSIQAGTNETGGWNDEAPQQIALTDVVRTSDTVVTLTLPAIPAYDITINESLTSDIPAEAVVTSIVDITSINSISILALGGNPSALFSGSILTATENQIVAGALQIVITLTDDTWIAAGTGPIGTIAQTDSIIDALIASTSQALGWNNVVEPGIETTDLVRTSSTIATITLDAESTYSIATNETIGMTIPNAVLVTSTLDLAVTNTFGIIAQSPVTCSLSGTVTATIDEADIVVGGKTIILTLAADTWVAPGTGPIGSTADTQAIIDGIDAASSPANGWNLVVQPGIETADLVRTSDTVATITLDAEATYDISAQEVITAVIPAAAMVISASTVTASPTFTVDFVTPTTAALTGTLDNATSRDVIAGGKTIILTLTSDTWVAAGATFDLQRQGIIDGLDAATSPANAWNVEVRDISLQVGDVVRTSNTVVTITVPDTAPYDVNANEAITATIPATALEDSTSAVIASNTADITAQVTFSGRFLVGYLGDSLGDKGTQELSHFDYNFTTQKRPVIGTSGDENFPYKAAYSESESQWVAMMGRENQDLWTSADDGQTWVSRATTGTPGLTLFGTLYRSDKHDDWINVVVDLASNYAEFSTDGITWTDFTSALTANITAFKDIAMNSNVQQARFQVMYGGNHIYCAVRDTSFNTTFVRSVDLTGAGEVSSNWGTSFLPNKPDGGSLSAWGTGNGRLLYIFADSPTGDWRLEHCTHGNQAWVLSSGILPKHTGSLKPFGIVFGNDTFVAMNGQGRVLYVDINGGAVDETDPTTWTKVDTQIFADGFSVQGCWYSADSAATTGQFVAWTQNGSGAAAKSRIYTSPDGITWTKRNTFEDRALTTKLHPKYTLDGTDLD